LSYDAPAAGLGRRLCRSLNVGHAPADGPNRPATLRDLSACLRTRVADHARHLYPSAHQGARIVAPRPLALPPGGSGVTTTPRGASSVGFSVTSSVNAASAAEVRATSMGWPASAGAVGRRRTGNPYAASSIAPNTSASGITATSRLSRRPHGRGREPPHDGNKWRRRALRVAGAQWRYLPGPPHRYLRQIPPRTSLAQRLSPAGDALRLAKYTGEGGSGWVRGCSRPDCPPSWHSLEAIRGADAPGCSERCRGAQGPPGNVVEIRSAAGTGAQMREPPRGSVN